jgi:hypothetical protein
MHDSWRSKEPGPYRADQFRSGDPYEISNGHLIECLPTGQRGSKHTISGGMVLGTDPDVKSAGFDTGISTEAKMLRAPDIVVGDLDDEPGWSKKAPPLAVEYADTGQDEPSLRQKIVELLRAGTKLIWVIRLHGPRCVEVHAPDAPVRLARIGDMLEAPGILRNPVPVSALYNPVEAERLTLRNLLQRRGYESLEEIQRKGRDEGRDEGRLLEARNALRRVLARRKLPLGPDDVARIDSCTDVERLERWHDRAVDAASTREALE